MRKEENTRRIEDFLKSEGAELVGFANLKDIENIPEEYQYGIIIAIPIEREALKTVLLDDQSVYVNSMKRVSEKLNSIILKGEEYIRDVLGFNALAMTKDRVMSDFKDLSTRIPYKTIGTRSGLGWIGRCALLINRDYGASLRISTILTDMPLVTGTPVDDSLCDDCTECQDVCPVNAINDIKWSKDKLRDEYFDADLCFEFIKGEMKRSDGRNLCARCGVVCPYTREYLGL